MTSENASTGGSLDGWDDELNDWTDATCNIDHKVRAMCDECIKDMDAPMCNDCHALFHSEDAEVEAQLEAANVCIRPRPDGFDPCTQPYDHTGRCDWFADALKLATRGGAA